MYSFEALVSYLESHFETISLTIEPQASDNLLVLVYPHIEDV